MPTLPSNTEQLLQLPTGWLVLVLFISFSSAIVLIGMLLKDARDREALMSQTAAKSAQAMLDMVALVTKLDANFQAHARDDALAFGDLKGDVKALRIEMDLRWDALRGMPAQIDEIRRALKLC